MEGQKVLGKNNIKHKIIFNIIMSQAVEHELTEKEQKKIDRLNKQIEDTYKKAFFDLLEQKTRAEPPDYIWIEKLYEELRNKLTAILKKGSTLRVEIEESMDTQIFSQMIRNKAFNATDLYNLINYVFEKCKQLGSPGRDKDVDEKFNELIEMVKKGAVFAEIVPVFIKNANECIDWMYQDMSEFSKKVSTLSNNK
tara:strand:- start:319 stop:906 length:588 start_codon:yes stop_codon:yes gene_type:complete